MSNDLRTILFLLTDKFLDFENNVAEPTLGSTEY